MGSMKWFNGVVMGSQCGRDRAACRAHAKELKNERRANGDL